MPGLHMFRAKSSDAFDCPRCTRSIDSLLCPDPVIFVDDRWLYDLEDELIEVVELDLSSQEPTITIEGKDLTIVGSCYVPHLAREGAKILHEDSDFCRGNRCEGLNPLRIDSIVDSVKDCTFVGC